MIIASLSLALASPLPACAPMQGWEEVAEAADGKFLIFGEMHGSAQSPQAVAEYICAASQTRSILLAIEFSSTSDEGFRAAWAGPHDEFRDRMLDHVPEWKGRPDGVGSVAMLDMLVRLHALKEAGRPIDLTSFNGARDQAQREAFAHLPAQEPHEAAQAANIRQASERGAYHQTVVLVGNLHARKQPVDMGPEPWRPMGMFLAAPEHIVSLQMAWDGGASWSCQMAADAAIEPGQPITDDMIECRAFPTGSAKRGAPGEGMGFYPEPFEDGAYDGYFHLGTIDASPPAFPDD